MPNVEKNRAWAEHLGTREYQGDRCPNGCTVQARGSRGRLVEIPAPIIDYSHVPGVGCSTCGAYWIPADRTAAEVS